MAGAAGTLTRSGTFVWEELVTADAAGAREFYGALFGWQHDQQQPTCHRTQLVEQTALPAQLRCVAALVGDEHHDVERTLVAARHQVVGEPGAGSVVRVVVRVEGEPAADGVPVVVQRQPLHRRPHPPIMPSRRILPGLEGRLGASCPASRADSAHPARRQGPSRRILRARQRAWERA